MSLVQFQRDRRPHHGICSIYVNPDDVSAVHAVDSNDNPTAIVMRNGEAYHVMGYAEDAARKINNAERREVRT